MAALVAVGSLISGVLVLAASNAQVKKEQEQTQQALEREQETSYVQRIALAGRELAAGNVGRAEELLDECPLDLRGWEWHFLKRQRYGNPPPMQHNTTVVRAAFSPDGRQLATASMDGTVAIRDSRTGQIVHELEHPTVLLGGALLAAWPTARMADIWRPRATTERFESGIRAAANYCTRSKHTRAQPGRSRSARIVGRWHPVARIGVCDCGTSPADK